MAVGFCLESNHRYAIVCAPVAHLAASIILERSMNNSIQSKHRTRWLLCLLNLFGLLLLVACGRQTAAASDLQITLTPAPAGAAGTYLTVQVADQQGQPVTDATVALEGNMNHAGMAPVITEGVQDQADGAADGVYQVPFGFTMLGDWIITVSVARPDGTETEQNIDVTVSDGVVEVKGP
jgi:hypothetical protein